MAFLERRQLLKVLYNNLRDKTKIYSSCKALEICLTDTGVRVKTDGEVFEGDIVVGADGVHSHVRREMERLAIAGGTGELFRKEDGEHRLPTLVCEKYGLTLGVRFQVQLSRDIRIIRSLQRR
jgi:2-polyprenyl-6-methoxyphenol hydroxylase-like FAD-dependent oxidoreductase